jgi:hypothetical protein
MQRMGPQGLGQVLLDMVPIVGDRRAWNRADRLDKQAAAVDDRDPQRSLMMETMDTELHPATALRGEALFERLTAIPGVGDIAALTKAGIMGLGAGGAGVIRAFHGTPHSFDKFDSSKIGSGEGAQAYGHGIYTAESEGVAKSYRDALSQTARKHNTLDGVRLSKRNIEQLALDDDPIISNFFRGRGRDAYGEKDINAALDGAIAHHTEQRAVFQRRLDKHIARPPQQSTYGPDDYRATIAAQDRQIQGLTDLKARVAHVPDEKTGNLYGVDIDAEPEDFLDWDLPLSEQPAGVQEALAKLEGVAVRDLPAIRGDQYYRRQYGGTTKPGFDALRGRDMRAAGIPGIRYPDGMSRGKDGKPKTYNYVVFDDSKLNITSRNGQPVGMVGGPSIVGKR